jgi:hypothetical protein
MTQWSDPVWMASRTAGAPTVLRERALRYFEAASATKRPARLEQAARAALESALGAGAGRPAALDLLAADGLITLALLAQAESDPAALGARARAMRRSPSSD